MKYEYYKLYDGIYRINTNWKQINKPYNTLTYINAEIYYNMKWISSFLTPTDIEAQNGIKITKEEAFMEML